MIQEIKIDLAVSLVRGTKMSWNDYVTEVLKEMTATGYWNYNLDRPVTRIDAMKEASLRRCQKDPIAAAKAEAHRKRRKEHLAKKDQPTSEPTSKPKHKIDMTKVRDEVVLPKAVESLQSTMYDVDVVRVKISRKEFDEFQMSGVRPVQYV